MKPFGLAEEAIFRGREAILKQKRSSITVDQTWGQIMLSSIISLIYREICKSSVTGMRKFAVG